LDATEQMIGLLDAGIGVALVVSEFTATLVAFTPPKVTVVVCFKLTPVMVTGVPTTPLVGDSRR
jgi:hypothetical protein